MGLTSNPLTINGRVHLQGADTPMPGLKIELWDTVTYGCIAGTTSDANGLFQFRLEDPVTTAVITHAITLHYHVYKGDVLLLDMTGPSDYTALVTLDISPADYDVKVPDNTPDESPGKYVVVSGSFTDATGILADKIKINIYESGLRYKALLTAVETDINGRFKAKVSTKNIGSSIAPVKRSIRVEAVDGFDNVLSVSADFFDWTSDIQVDLIAAAGAYKATSEFDSMRNAIAAISDSIDLASLTADAEDGVDELRYVAGATDRHPKTVELLVQAHKYSNDTGQPADYFYALGKTAGTDRNPLLGMKEADIRAVIADAIDQNIIATRSSEDINDFVVAAKDYQVTATRNIHVTNEGVTINDLLTNIFDSSADINGFLKQYTVQDYDTVPAFWDAYKTAAGAEKAEKAQRGLKLITVTGSQPEMVGKLMEITGATDSSFHAIATLDETGWFDIVKNLSTEHSKLCVPVSIRGEATEDSDDTIKMAYARKLKTVAQDFFPLVALHGKLGNYEGQPLIEDEEVRIQVQSFITNNPSFDVRTESIHDINAEDYDLSDVSDIDALKAGLAPFQRLLRVTGGKPEAVAAMKVANIDSAEAITQLSQEAFVTTYGDALGGDVSASMAYAKASAVAAVTANTLTDVTQKLVDPGLAVLPGFALNDLVDPEAQPDLATLFGSMDYCSCQECLSLYSPAAYMTDMLNFLRTKVPAAYTELTRRRPDLKYIDLTCKNTNTTLPYVDLVNELLELAILKQGGVTPLPLSFQTGGNAKDLAAYPEHVQRNLSTNAYDDYYAYKDVYDIYLSAAVYPYENPFNLAVEETRTYLKHLGLSRLDAMNLFKPVNQAPVSNTSPAPADEITDYTIYAEYLGLTREALDIIVTDEPADPWRYYGLSGSTVANMIDPSDSSAVLNGTWDALLTGRLDVLMQQAKISYAELLELLNTDFLNKRVSGETRNINVAAAIGSPSDTCVTSKLRLVFTSPETPSGFLKKLHRMIRLVRTGKMNIYQWDTILRTLGITKLTTDEMLLLGQILLLADKLKIKPEILACWWNDIDTHQYTNYKSETLNKLDSVYDTVFRNKQVVSTSATAFPAYDQVGTLGNYEDNAATIAALCRMREDEFFALLNLMQVDPSDAMILTILSRIYVLSLLSKSLGYSVADMLHVFTFAHVTPGTVNSSGIAAISASVSKLLSVQQMAAIIKGSGFRLDELNYLLRNYDPVDRLNPDIKGIQYFYEDLRKELQKFPLFTPVNPASLSDTEKEQLAKLVNIIFQHFSKEFNCPSEWIKALFTDQFVAPVSYFIEPAFVKASYDLSQDNCLHLTSGSPELGDDVLPSFDLIELYDFYRIFYKVVFVAQKLKIKTGELSYIVNPAGNFNYFSFYDLPYQVDSNGELAELVIPASFAKTFCTLPAWIAVRKKLSLNEDEFAAMVDAAAGQDKITLIKLLSRDIENADAVEKLIGKATDINDVGLLKLDAGTDFTPSVYENVSRFISIIDIINFCTRTGLKPDTLHKTLRPAAGLTDSRKVLLAAKGKYSDAEWGKIAKPLRDVLRRKQRSALVGYVLAHPDASAHMRWLNENDLFAYLLIDVEMDSCMVTSRIKQAISSIQLFIDRILMGLEKTTTNAAIALTPDQAKQWETWRKWYRIWEANRKIFLYPENWIEPELRDDKSVFFEELETALQQDDLTPERAQDAIYDYLLKLDETARMEPVGIVDQLDDVTKKTTTHVFARTYADPQHYFYRRLLDDEWTPWERVDIDIKSEHVAPVIWNNRLYLFWLTFKDKQVKMPLGGASISSRNKDIWFYNNQGAFPGAIGDVSNDDSEITVKQRQFEISLNWTEYKNGNWLKHKIGKDKAILNFKSGFEDIYGLASFADKSNGNVATKPLTAFYDFLTNKREISIVELARTRFYLRPQIRTSNNHLHLMLLFPYKLWDTSGEQAFYIHGFEFSDNSTDPQVWRYPDAGATGIFEWNVPAPGGTAYSNMRFIRSLSQKTTKLNVDTYTVNPNEGIYVYREERFDNAVSPTVRSSSAAILNKTYDDVYKVLVKSNFQTNPMEDSFFFEDNKNTFFVRKMSSDKHLTNPVVKSNEVNLSIAGYASSGIYQDSGQTPGHIDLTGIHVSAYDDNTNIVPAPAVPAYYFQTFYHPHMRQFIETFNRDGIDSMLKIAMQVQTDAMHFQTNYLPTNLVHPDYPVDKVDFDYWGAYSGYNWELFFHVPMMIAQRLSDNQQFEEARKWFHYIFDPTSNQDAPTGSVQRFWKFRPFYDAAGQPVQTLDDLLILISYNNPAAVAQVKKWEDNPFKPHVIARMRILAYMKNVVMKYIDNLVAWGDQLFRRDTIESINEATQLYILAANILGKKPVEVQRRSQTSPKSFDQISGTLDEFSNARVFIESYIDVNAAVSSGGTTVHHAPQMFYFCLSRNEKLMGYWDTVADRLFKIRNCMNIEGQVRQLPLFEPPIDPALLVRAAAAGLDINSVLNDLTSAPAHYRFSYVLAKANEFCGDVKALGNALLSALEKKDAEHLALLRSGQEISLLEKIRLVKQAQIDEANANLEALQQTRDITEARYEYYSSRPFMNDKEREAMQNIQTGMILAGVAGEMSVVTSVLSAIPGVHIQGISSGTSQTNWGAITQAISNQLGILGTIANTKGSLAATMAGYERRQDDWQFQAATAQQELVQIDKQIVAAEIRVAIAEKDLDNHELQMDNARETDDYMRNKFTNEQLYSWMSAQLSATYFQAYQLAYDMAKKAEQCYNYELPLSKKATNGFIKFGYWDSLKKGLLAGEKMQYDLHKMEAAYMEDNEREMELTRHVSLAMFDPKQILDLREKGSCTFYLPEELFDLDYPGHYLRRIKSVSISIPCVAGPYTTINATLRLLNSWKRKNDDDANAAPENDGLTIQQSIATSGAQNDSGLFELNFRDERYLPFEGRGAISEWELKLSDETVDRKQLRLFDFNTINDVVVHVRYTAREGQQAFKDGVIDKVNGLLETPPAENDLEQMQLPRYFSLRHEFANDWFAYANKVASGVTGWQMAFKINPGMFPAFTKGKKLHVNNLYFKLRAKKALADNYKLYVTYQVNGVETTDSVSLATPDYSGSHAVSFDVNGNTKILKLKLKQVDGSTETTVNMDEWLDDLYMVAYYAMDDLDGPDDDDVDYTDIDDQLLINSMLAWWRADEGVTKVGGLVDAWLDQTGNGNTLTAVSAAARPELISDWRNGKPALRFNGAQALRKAMMTLPSNTRDMTVFLVGEKTDATSGSIFELSDNTDYSMGLGFTFNISNMDIAVLSSTTGYNIHGVDWNITKYVKGIYVLGYNMSDPNPETSVEFNNELYEDSYGAWAEVNNVLSYFTSKPFSLGASGGTQLYGHFNIAELIIMPSKATQAQRSAIKAYLKAKYDL